MDKQPSILVIDDEPVVCESCTRILSRENYYVKACLDPRIGVQQALTNDFDLILLDLKMDKMDGLELLSRIRKRKPETPVIIITGYPTKRSKEDSIKLNISNYILKPFQPDEILDPVNKILKKSESYWKTKSIFTGSEQQTKEISYKHLQSKYTYINTGWQHKEKNGMIKVGGLVPCQLTKSIASVRLIEINDSVFCGLPLMEITYNNKTKYTIPSAATGRIKEVNKRLLENPSLILNNEYNWCWVANVEPNFTEKNQLMNLDVWKIGFLSEDYSHNIKYCRHFNDLGCEVYRTKSLEGILSIIARFNIKVLIIDSVSFPHEPLEFIKILKNKFPEVKIIVFDITESTSEQSYRNNNIFYYTKYPVSRDEISDILYSCFCLNNTTGIFNENTSSGLLPHYINRISIKNVHGKKITLLNFDNILRLDTGIGLLLIKKLKDKSIPVDFDYRLVNSPIKGSVIKQRILKAQSESDKVILVQAKELNRIPGNIQIEKRPVNNVDHAKNSILAIAIQQKSQGPDGMCFDPTTIESLTEILEVEMTMI